MAEPAATADEVAALRAELAQAQHQLGHARHQLVQQDRMSSLGRLVAGIAHELNNPINFVYGNVDFLADYVRDLLTVVDAALALVPRLPAELAAELLAVSRQVELEHLRADIPKLLRSMRAGAERTATIVRDLRTFSRPVDAVRRPVDLLAQVETTLTLITPLVRDRITIRRAVAADLPTVIGNPGHLGQVLMNLLTNAAQAVSGDGWIEIGLAASADGGLRLWVADSGAGIADDAMGRLSEPFFTTKEVGEGTGLGLWITDTIVRAHGGTMAWRNRAGAGAEFEIVLPAAPAAP
jgi:two-component system NtrC family sensor kinase